MQKFWLLIFIILLFSSQSDLISKMIFYMFSFYCSFAVGANQSAINLILLFGNWFWHLIIASNSILLYFYHQRPVFAQKNHPRPTKAKKDNEGKNAHTDVPTSHLIILKIVRVYNSIQGCDCLKSAWQLTQNYLTNSCNVSQMALLTLTWQLARKGVPKKIADFLYVQQGKWSNK